MEATAEEAANSGPCSSRKKTETGPDMSGMEAKAPPTAGPQRRMSNVATAISSGVLSSLNRNMNPPRSGTAGNAIVLLFRLRD